METNTSQRTQMHQGLHLQYTSNKSHRRQACGKFTCKSENCCDTEILIDLDYIQNVCKLFMMELAFILNKANLPI